MIPIGIETERAQEEAVVVDGGGAVVTVFPEEVGEKMEKKEEVNKVEES